MAQNLTNRCHTLERGEDADLDPGQWHDPRAQTVDALAWLPTNASWLDQIEIWFSVLQRKLLHPNHFLSTDHQVGFLVRVQLPLCGAKEL